jgi:CubicO group peptidase (beta-lactamase class C family)
MRPRALALALALTACSRRCDDAPARRDGAVAIDATPELPRAQTAGPDDSRLRALADRAREGARVPSLAFGSFSAGHTSTGAVGMADVAASRPSTGATRYQIASIAKVVVAIAVMQLVDEGRVSLDDDVSRIVGFTVGAGGRVSLRALLSHTAGLVDRTAELERASRDVPLAAFLRAYWADAGAPRGSADAGAYAYSNAGVALAALAVERVSGAPYAERVHTHVFAPARMTTCSFAPAPSDAVPHAARDGGAPEALPHASHAVYPVVDLWCSVGDVVRLGRLLLGRGALEGRRVVSADRVAEMLAPAVGTSNEGQGLGVQLRTIGGRRVAGHEGEDHGAASALYVDLERGVVAAALANGDAFAGGDPARVRAFADLVDALVSPPGP